MDRIAAAIKESSGIIPDTHRMVEGFNGILTVSFLYCLGLSQMVHDLRFQGLGTRHVAQSSEPKSQA